jgi:hypothetical protein
MDGSISSGAVIEDAKITERFRQRELRRMEIDITVDDPKAYTKPWTVRHVRIIRVGTVGFIAWKTGLPR